MAELRHSASMGNRASAGSSPVKRDDPSAPFVSAGGADGGGRDRDRDRDKDPHRAPFASSVLHLPPPIRSLLALEDPRVSTSTAYRILVAFLAFLVLAGLLSLPSLWSRLVSPSSSTSLLPCLICLVVLDLGSLSRLVSSSSSVFICLVILADVFKLLSDDNEVILILQLQ
ncbi:hypothetical protein BHE74_00031773 [Ensete ventricosum]|nr:hypothetical protein GW17_00036209 [Ensete ventricosum]RWW61184.1 hypothetical protein BHE74_00031773 [Ensete ventricosum]